MLLAIHRVAVCRRPGAHHQPGEAQLRRGARRTTVIPQATDEKPDPAWPPPWIRRAPTVDPAWMGSAQLAHEPRSPPRHCQADQLVVPMETDVQPVVTATAAPMLLGCAEHDGTGRPINYAGLEPFVTMDQALSDGRVRVYCLGLTLDALTPQVTASTGVGRGFCVVPMRFEDA
jgi:hypothetical protein